MDEPTKPTITLVHAVLPAVAPMEAAVRAELPGAVVRHLFDEGLSSEAARYGGVNESCVARMLDVLDLAARAQTDVILMTCTAYSTMLDRARGAFPDIPIFAVDQMMVDAAVADYGRIGVLATFQPGFDEQRRMLEAAATRLGKSIEVIGSVHPSAMTALRAGDGETHDRILLEALPALAARTDVVLFAQVSMARAIDQVPAALRDRVLSSPKLAAGMLAEHFASRSPK